MIARHIFVFFECFTLGGVERSALRHMGEWVRQGRRVTLFVGAPEGPLLAELPEGVEMIGGGVDSYAAMFWPTIAAVRATKPDLIFVPGNRYTSIACAIRLALGRACPPLVCKISNSFERGDQSRMHRLGYGIFLRAHAKLIDRFAALSGTMRRDAIRVAGMSADQVSIIADPVIARTQPTPATVAGPPTIAFVGRMVPQKRVPMLVEAFARVPASIGARLEIVGDGPEQAEVEAAIAAHGLAGRVTLHGYLADPGPVLARARVLALASSYEGLPAVIPEAFALGTPVVTTDSTSSLAELIDDPRLGTVVPRDDVDALARAMAERAAEEPDRAWIRARARRRAGWPDAAGQYLALFDRLVAGRATTRLPGRAALLARALYAAARALAPREDTTAGITPARVI